MELDRDELDWATDSNRKIKQAVLANLSAVDEYDLKLGNIKVKDEKILFYANMVITPDLITEVCRELQDTFDAPFEFEESRLMMVNSKPCLVTIFTQ